jgi:DNA-binding transcriptional LysR family regulator
MDVERLRAFLAVADQGHFGHAAERLHITQPGLTKRIRALEEQIGGQIFDRDRQPVRLTPLGTLLLPQVRRLVRDADALLHDARGAVDGQIGHLNIGFGLSTIAVAPWLVARFRAAYPGVSISMDDYSSHEQVNRLRRDELDLGFIRLPAPPDLTACPLASDRLAIAVPQNLDIPSGARSRSWLAAQDFIALREARGPGLAAQVRAWCRSAAFNPKVVQEADDIQTVLALVSAGLGCAIVPVSSEALLPGRLRLLAVEGKEAAWSIGAAWKAQREVGALGHLVRIVRAGVPMPEGFGGY